MSAKLLVAQEIFPGFGNTIVLKPRAERVSLQETSSYQQITLWKTQKTVVLNIRLLFKADRGTRKRENWVRFFQTIKVWFIANVLVSRSNRPRGVRFLKQLQSITYINVLTSQLKGLNCIETAIKFRSKL